MKTYGFIFLFSGLLPLFVFAHFAHHLLNALLVPLLPMIRNSFSLDYTQSGFVISAFSLASGIGQVPAGWLADRFGPRLLISVGVAGVALAGLFIGLSQTYTVLIVFLVLMGLAGGGYHPSAPPLISDSVKWKNRGRALGFHVIGGGASFFLAPLIAAAVATVWGWRAPFIGLSLPILVFGIMLYVLLGRRGVVGHKDGSISQDYEETAFTRARFRRLVAFITMSSFTQAAITSVIAFIPLFMVDHFGLSEGTAAVSLAILHSTGLWVGPLGGFLSDRLGAVPIMIAVSFISGIMIYLLNVVPQGMAFAAVLFTMGLLIYIRMPASESYIVEGAPLRYRSTALGIYYFSGIEGGGVLTPVIGRLIDGLGFYISFTIVGGALVVVTLLCSMGIWASRH